MKVRSVYASTVAALDSNVHSGGGTDVTQALQAVLDQARDGDGVHLIMDGAALVTHLKVHSNTTIECLNRDCGFYQKDGSDDAIVTNFKNIRHNDPNNAKTLFEIGLPFWNTTPDTIDDYPYKNGISPVIDLLQIDGLTVLEDSEKSANAEYIQVFGKVRNLIVKNVTAIKNGGLSCSGHLIAMHKRAEVDTALIKDVHAIGYAGIISGREKVHHLIAE